MLSPEWFELAFPVMLLKWIELQTSSQNLIVRWPSTNPRHWLPRSLYERYSTSKCTFGITFHDANDGPAIWLRYRKEIAESQKVDGEFFHALLKNVLLSLWYFPNKGCLVFLSQRFVKDDGQCNTILQMEKGRHLEQYREMLFVW